MLALFLTLVSIEAAVNAEDVVPYVPDAGQVELTYWMQAQVSYVNVTIEFPDSGFAISSWGAPNITGHTIAVDAEIWDWLGLSMPGIITMSHTYTLGDLVAGDYAFCFEAWGSSVKSTTFHVSPAVVPDDYPAIQAAVDAAPPGDTVFVRSGIYYEHVVVNKSLSLIGENKDTTVIDGLPITPELDYVSLFVKDVMNVHIAGFTLRNGPMGLELDHAHHCTITDNRIDTNYCDGLVLFDSNNNTILQNVIASNDGAGIDLVWSSNNSVVQNAIVNNTCGIQVQDASGNVIYRNNLVDNLWQAASTPGSHSVWDNGCEGNYWSDYRQRYANASFDVWGIGDTPYAFDHNQDHCPLMNVFWTPCDTDHDLDVDLFDLVKVCHFYGTPHWIDECRHVDLAEPYGVIDIFDIVTITVRYGDKYTP